MSRRWAGRIDEFRGRRHMACGEHSSRRRRTWVRGVVAATVGLAATLTMSGAATARSAAEATTLQNRVDSYLARLGGTQIAPDRIQLAKGVVLKLAVPTAAGGVGSASRTAAYDCKYKHFCAYSEPY